MPNPRPSMLRLLIGPATPLHPPTALPLAVRTLRDVACPRGRSGIEPGFHYGRAAPARRRRARLRNGSGRRPAPLVEPFDLGVVQRAVEHDELVHAAGQVA